jgi:hypothetical protein
MEATKEIEDMIHAELERFATAYIAQRIAFLRSRKTEASGELIDSFAYEFERQARAEAVVLVLAFADQGRFVDMKPQSIAYASNISPIDKLAAWVEKKGLEKFLKGYEQRRKYVPVNTQKLLYSIAWGIAKTRWKGKFKRKPWYAKSKTAAVAELVNKVVAQLPQTASDILRGAFLN